MTAGNLVPMLAYACRITAKVKGADAAFYSSPEEGEEFELEKVQV